MVSLVIPSVSRKKLNEARNRKLGECQKERRRLCRQSNSTPKEAEKVVWKDHFDIVTANRV